MEWEDAARHASSPAEPAFCPHDGLGGVCDALKIMSFFEAFLGDPILLKGLLRVSYPFLRLFKGILI